jgi:hypothetical protein
MKLMYCHQNGMIMPYKKGFSPNARYFKPIDWLLVQQLIDEGLSGIEIAKIISVHPNSLYHRVLKEHGWHLCHWMHKRRLALSGNDYDLYPQIKTMK